MARRVLNLFTGQTIRREDVRIIVIGVIVFAIAFFVFNLIRNPIAAYVVQSSLWDLPPSDGSVSPAEHVQAISAQALAILMVLGSIPYLLMSYFMARQRAESTLVLALAVTAVALLLITVPGDFRQSAHYLSIAIDAVFAGGATFLGCRLGSRVNRLIESKS